MARPRVYRQGVRCPECGSNWMPKAGSVNGRQVYRCGDCQRRSTPDASCHRPSSADKERALAMYREGSSMRAVARAALRAPMMRRVQQFHAARWRRFRGQRPVGEPVGQKRDARYSPGCGSGAVSVPPEQRGASRRR